MKNIITISLIALTTICKAQLDTNYIKSLNHTPNSNKEDLRGVFTCISIMTIPYALMISSQEPNFVNVAYGIGTAISATTGILAISWSKKKSNFRNLSFALAGVMDGFSQELLFHYPYVKERMPYLNDQFFDPAISWQNKYTSKLPFSETLLVGTTDAYHASRSLNKMLMISGVILIDRKQPFKKQVKQLIIGSIIYTSFKGLTHFYFKP